MISFHTLVVQPFFSISGIIYCTILPSGVDRCLKVYFLYELESEGTLFVSLFNMECLVGTVKTAFVKSKAFSMEDESLDSNFTFQCSTLTTYWQKFSLAVIHMNISIQNSRNILGSGFEESAKIKPTAWIEIINII